MGTAKISQRHSEALFKVDKAMKLLGSDALLLPLLLLVTLNWVAVCSFAVCRVLKVIKDSFGCVSARTLTSPSTAIHTTSGASPACPYTNDTHGDHQFVIQ